MAKVILSMTMTADGFFAGPDGELDWMSQVPDPELAEDIVSFFAGIDRGFIGYPTASGMIPFWLSVADDPAASDVERAIAGAVNKLRPIVVSSRQEDLPCARSRQAAPLGARGCVASSCRVRTDDLRLPAVPRTAHKAGRAPVRVLTGRAA